MFNYFVFVTNENIYEYKFSFYLLVIQPIHLEYFKTIIIN
jgi:hypothetical protein